MISNIKELFRWLSFIPVPLIAGPIAGALLLIPILFISSTETTLVAETNYANRTLLKKVWTRSV